MKNWLLVPLLAAALATAAPGNVYAQGLPDGVSVQVVGEYAADVDGLEKVLLRKITLEPGSSLTIPVSDPTFCDATEGLLTVLDEGDGSTAVYSPGSRWAPVVGHTYTITNQGSVTHSHYAYVLIRM